MRKTLLSLLAISFALSLHAQSPCGTILSPEMKGWLKDYSNHPEKYPFSASSREMHYIPLKIHLVGTDNGSGYYPLVYVWQNVCELNQKYAPVGFYFYIYGDLHYINNSDYYSHDWNDGADMMYENNVEDVVNVYFVNDPAGNCGYYTYGPDALAVAISCSGPGNTTLAHELGHYFSLPHPFDNVNEIKEYVDGSNCPIGGDLFCDTRADFLDYRWPCPYTGSETDGHGDTYDPDETLYMSYSLDECQNHFSGEQTDAMTNMLLVNRPGLLNHPVPNTNTIADGATLISPVEDAADVPQDWVEFKWNEVPNATFYQLQVTKYFTFNTVLAVNMIVNGTAFTTTLESDVTYKWRVKPLSEGYTCAEFSQEGNFSTVLGTGVNDLQAAASSLKVYPTLARANSGFFVSLESSSSSNANVELISVNGQVVSNFQQPINAGNNLFNVNTSTLSPGLYLVQVNVNNQVYRSKVVIGE